MWKELPQHPEKSGVMMSHRQGEDVLFVTYGSMLDNVLQASEILEKAGIQAGVIRLLTLSAFPAEEILKHLPKSSKIMVVEETAHGSGISDRLGTVLRSLNPSCQIAGLDLGPDYVPHGQIQKLYEYCGVDPESIAHKTKEWLKS